LDAESGADFVTWTLAVVGYLRGLLPGVAGARRRGTVILRYGRRTALIRDEAAGHYDERGATP